MKLAEALANRADLQRRIEQMRGGSRRAPSSRRVRARRRIPRGSSMRRRGSSPSSRGMYGASTGRTSPRRSPTARRRSRTPWRRDALTLRYGTLKTLVSTASDRVPRYGRAEIRILSAVEVGPLRRRMDELARQRRELDTSIQEANWAIDLTED
jgi:hypothetical protein